MHANSAATSRGFDMCINLAPNLRPKIYDSLRVGEAEMLGGRAIFVHVVLQNVFFCVL